jgi:hypothetical protein
LCVFVVFVWDDDERATEQSNKACLHFVHALSFGTPKRVWYDGLLRCFYVEKNENCTCKIVDAKIDWILTCKIKKCLRTRSLRDTFDGRWGNCVWLRPVARSWSRDANHVIIFFPPPPGYIFHQLRLQDGHLFLFYNGCYVVLQRSTKACDSFDTEQIIPNL